jgi:hypothetical protein
MPEQRRARMGANCRRKIPLLLVLAKLVLLGEHSAAMTTVWQGQHTRTPHSADTACSLSHCHQYSSSSSKGRNSPGMSCCRSKLRTVRWTAGLSSWWAPNFCPDSVQRGELGCQKLKIVHIKLVKSAAACQLLHKTPSTERKSDCTARSSHNMGAHLPGELQQLNQDTIS